MCCLLLVPVVASVVSGVVFVLGFCHALSLSCSLSLCRRFLSCLCLCRVSFSVCSVLSSICVCLFCHCVYVSVFWLSVCLLVGVWLQLFCLGRCLGLACFVCVVFVCVCAVSADVCSPTCLVVAFVVASIDRGSCCASS